MSTLPCTDNISVYQLSRILWFVMIYDADRFPANQRVLIYCDTNQRMEDYLQSLVLPNIIMLTRTAS